MANQETQKLDNILTSRRAMLIGGGAAALAAVAMTQPANAAATVSSYTDFDILNFALNLEYLEANFYYMAAFGCTIFGAGSNAAAKAAGAAVIPTGAAGATLTSDNVTVGTATAVPFTLPTVKSYAIETAVEEGKHVLFLQSAIKQFGGTAVAQPNIDISPAGAFTTLANAAAANSPSIVIGAPFLTGGQFNPYANDVAFLAGAYVFEDVGVTAYKGAAPLITTGTNGKSILQAAASILAVEAYHSGLIRSNIYVNDPTGSLGYLAATQSISRLRTKLANAALSTAPFPDDFGIYPGTYPQSGTTNPPAVGTVSLAGGTATTSSNIAVADPTSLVAFGRTTTQVLNIVTGGNATTAGAVAKGVFFPNGLNGTFS